MDQALSPNFQWTSEFKGPMLELLYACEYATGDSLGKRLVVVHVNELPVTLWSYPLNPFLQGKWGFCLGFWLGKVGILSRILVGCSVREMVLCDSVFVFSQSCMAPEASLLASEGPSRFSCTR